MPKARLSRCSALAFSIFFPWFPIVPPQVPEAEQPSVAAPAPAEAVVLPGVVIEEISKGSALEKAGLQVGDVILSWERLPNPPANPEGARGNLDNPFDWMWLEIEQAPRGVVRLLGEREDSPLSFEVSPGQWGAAATINFSPSLASWYLRGRLLETRGEVSSAIEEWRSLASWLGHRNANEVEAWLNVRIGKILAEQGSQNEAKSHYLRANGMALDDLAKSQTLDLTAKFFFESGEFQEAEKFFRAALELKKDKSLGDLDIARSMSNLAVALYHQGRKSEVDGYLHTAHETYSKLAPQAPELIKLLRNLGVRAKELGNLDQSIKYHQESIAIAEIVSPNSKAHAASLHELGTLERDSGRMREALAHLSQALELRERLEPKSANLANTLNALSMCYRTQADLDQALVLARRSVQLAESLKGGEGYIVAGLNTIALIENALGQWPEAEADLARALDLAPKSNQAYRLIPLVLANMAMVQENQGHLSEALQTYLKALDLKKKNGLPGEIALTLRSLGILHYRLGKIEQARSYLTEALSLLRKKEPNSVDTADTLGILASVLSESGDAGAARNYFAEALRIIEAVAPTSSVASSIYSNYGLVERRLGSLATAKRLLLQAVELSDSLFLRASNSYVALNNFSGRHYSVYGDAADVYVTLGEVNSALEVSERARGRSLRMQLAERDLLSLSDIPEQVLEKLRHVEKALERTENRVLVIPDNNSDAVHEIKLRLEQRALFREKEQLLAEVRRSSPRLAMLQFPLTLSAEEIRNALDSGTHMIAFLLGATRSFLFSVSHDDDVRVQVLQIGENEIRQRVQTFRSLIAEARLNTVLGQLRAAELRRLSKELYKQLIHPVAEHIEKADRILVVVDGPLHYLPFGALVREVASSDGQLHDEYIAEWKPLHSVLSAAIYADLKRERRGPQQDHALLLGAFGDPKFPADLSKVPEQITDIRVHSAVRRGTLQFEPLPFSRREVEGIAALFPPEKVTISLGEEATEERAKAMAKGTRILHFATHARMDDQFPLNSALALTMPEGFPEDRDNGLLQVWEIFERVRLDADLVVLSACETALGEEQGGEGLIGLTRAFQYAGARTVMASLWSVQDQATSELMIRFYKHLRAGLPKDEALRQAQIELIRGPIEVVNEKGEKTVLDASSPYFWAGFQLYGDWQ
jgi:CHAT domain-containing protein/Tfp pilus assembly protein PilF